MKGICRMVHCALNDLDNTRSIWGKLYMGESYALFFAEQRAPLQWTPFLAPDVTPAVDVKGPMFNLDQVFTWEDGQGTLNTVALKRLQEVE